MTQTTLAQAISDYGTKAKAKLSNIAIAGAPEDQLRAPMEALVGEDLAALCGHSLGSVRLVGETTLSHNRTRPDYAVTLRGALIGFIEVKAPGKEPTLGALPIGTTRISSRS